MPDWLENTLIIAVSIASSLIFLWLVRRRVPPSKLKETNDIAGFYSAVIGTIYAVLLAFLLASVWTEFDKANVNAIQEANALVAVFRTADGLPAPERLRLKAQAHDYARIMLTDEWPAMEHDRVSRDGEVLMQKLWVSIIHLQPRTPADQVVFGQLMTELNTLMEHRRLRHLQSRQKLPGILWTVLIFGAVITVGFSCLFGVEDPYYHGVTTMVLALMVSLVLVAIADVDRPYQGGVHVPPDGFRLALQTFDQLPLR